ncbi:amino acid ABC transporter, periplasmic amino acid-binding protein [Brachybacterium faecium]|uniref:Amino acid-binding protein n=1 Tax=Brachybacterium faecium (strain ATCC 43885 / DSM 4810 / JCM 11609 / LMG 19847 / NBRC 14762 / NCIMB 9860 / 6-10) TaxID=446465 RepID=C7M9N8_BRAFD|nr:transporter substrate-binding domain-containing protein [Brachybacterium faecium]ACU84582.1 amino acid-binding protein [Brachybacterium faecium DSM 4810]SLM96123.1 amino acid ABC transporter, periplasmic amino acid-binding protein [Brachybacterium faecium]HJG51242.1 transporter substrate-binding domain-containing protein [Brachybacterium faecium]
MQNRRSFIRGSGLVLSAAALGGLAACSRTSSGGDDEGDLLSRLQDAGKITVGFAGEAPYSFDEGGEVTGATVALHREIFGELGIDTVEGKLTDWGSLIPGLNAGQFDAVSAGMSILPDRCSEAAFSEPEFQYTTALMVPEGNPEGLENMQSFVDSDLVVATMAGAIESDYVKELDLDSIEVGGPQDGVDALKAGNADAFALTAISLNYLADNTVDGVDVTDSFVAEIDGVKQFGAGGTVFRKDDSSLLDAYNEKLAEIIADPERYLSIVGEFGFTEEELPPEDMTTEILCSGDLSSLQ